MPERVGLKMIKLAIMIIPKACSIKNPQTFTGYVGKAKEAVVLFLRKGQQSMPRTSPATPIDAPDLHGSGPVVVVGSQRGSLAGALDWLVDQSVPVRLFRSLEALAISEASAEASHALIDLDAIGGVENAYEALRRLREDRPGLPVIMASNFFRADDFGLERLPLCDVSLRLPCSFAAFEFALSLAEINNQIWQDRKKGRDHD